MEREHTKLRPGHSEQKEERKHLLGTYYVLGLHSYAVHVSSQLTLRKTRKETFLFLFLKNKYLRTDGTRHRHPHNCSSFNQQSSSWIR